MKVAKLKEKKKIPAKSFDEKKNVKLGYVAARSEEHTSELQSPGTSRMPSSA